MGLKERELSSTNDMSFKTIFRYNTANRDYSYAWQNRSIVALQLDEKLFALKISFSRRNGKFICFPLGEIWHWCCCKQANKFPNTKIGNSFDAACVPRDRRALRFVESYTKTDLLAKKEKLWFLFFVKSFCFLMSFGNLFVLEINIDLKIISKLNSTYHQSRQNEKKKTHLKSIHEE